MGKVLRYLFCLLGGFFLFQILIRVVRKLFHFPAPAFIGRILDSSLRRRMQPPEDIIERSGFAEGMTVLEVGCGSGAYTLYVAEKVGHSGKVYALDLQEKMLSQLERKIRRWGSRYPGNVEPLQASAYEIPLQENSVDIVYFITVLQEIPDRQRALKEAKRVLKKGGILAVTEFLPDPDYPLKSSTKLDLRRAGFTIDAVEGSFWTYTVRGRK